MKKESNTPAVKEPEMEIMTGQEAGLHDRAVALRDHINTARDQAAEKYVDLCLWIRKNAIPPKRVTEILLAAGFVKQRVAEVNRIAQCSDELWKEYEARKIGRNRMLELVRGGDESEDVSEVEGVAEESEGTGSEAGGPEFVEDPEDVKKRKLLTMAKCAKTILNTGEFLNLKKKSWDLGNGWELTLKKGGKGANKKGPSVGKTEAKTDK